MEKKESKQNKKNDRFVPPLASIQFFDQGFSALHRLFFFSFLFSFQLRRKLVIFWKCSDLIPTGFETAAIIRSAVLEDGTCSRIERAKYQRCFVFRIRSLIAHISLQL